MWRGVCGGMPEVRVSASSLFPFLLLHLLALVLLFLCCTLKSRRRPLRQVFEIQRVIARLSLPQCRICFLVLGSSHQHTYIQYNRKWRSRARGIRSCVVLIIEAKAAVDGDQREWSTFAGKSQCNRVSTPSLPSSSPSRRAEKEKRSNSSSKSSVPKAEPPLCSLDARTFHFRSFQSHPSNQLSAAVPAHTHTELRSWLNRNSTERSLFSEHSTGFSLTSSLVQ